MENKLDENLVEDFFKKVPNEGIRIHGSFHLQILENDEIVGDSGWHENQVVDLGFLDYLCKSLGSSTGSKYITHVGLGTGTAPGATDTSLQGEVGTRQSVTFATSSNSKKARFLATFAAGWHTSSAAYDISNIGLFNTSSGGTLFAGNTYASSSCASNQAVNVTYDIDFS